MKEGRSRDRHPSLQTTEREKIATASREQHLRQDALAYQDDRTCIIASPEPSAGTT